MVIHDDMLDGALVRRGRPCWHTLEDVGVYAGNLLYRYPISFALTLEIFHLPN